MLSKRKSNLISAYTALLTISIGTIALDRSARNEAARREALAGARPQIESVVKAGPTREVASTATAPGRRSRL